MIAASLSLCVLVCVSVLCPRDILQHFSLKPYTKYRSGAKKKKNQRFTKVHGVMTHLARSHELVADETFPERNGGVRLMRWFVKTCGCFAFCGTGFNPECSNN